MYHSKNFSLVQNNIINYMMHEDRPVTVSQMAKALNVTYQTVANHLPELKSRQVVIENGKRGNAMTYILGNPKDALIAITWQAQETTIIDLLSKIASGETPVAKNSFGREILYLLNQMLRLATDHVDDDNPKPLTIATLKEIQSRFAQRRNIVKQLAQTYESILDNPELWEPQALIKAFVVRDENFSIERSRAITENVNEKLEN